MAAEQAAGSLAYPFRKGWPRAWLVGVPLAFICPLGAIPLLGYSVETARAVAAGDLARLPPWRLTPRLLGDGALLLALLLAVTAPFAVAEWLLSAAIAGVLPVSDAFLARSYGLLAGGAGLGLLWALVALLVLPPGLARYARSGRARDLLDLAATARMLRTGFWAWNLAGVPIVTAWAITLLAVCAGGVGAPFAAFYAILVSAHASATLLEAAG